MARVKTKRVILRVWHDGRELAPDSDESLVEVGATKVQANIKDVFGYHDGLSFTDYSIPVEKMREVLGVIKQYDDPYLVLGPECRLGIRGKMCVAPASVARFKDVYLRAYGENVKNAILTENRIIIRTVHDEGIVNTYFSRTKFLEETAEMALIADQVQEETDLEQRLGI